MISTRDLFDTWDAKSQADRETGLGPSDVGKCARQLAYKLHGVPASDESDKSAAILGTLIHRAYADVLTTTYATWERQAEVPVAIPHLTRKGTADDVDWEARVVSDLKTLDPAKFDSWHNNGGPPDEVWAQLQLYALGFATLTDNHDWRVRVAAVCRRSGRTNDYVIPYDQTWATELAADLGKQQAELLAQEPTLAPQEGRGRNAAPCSYCPWRSTCLGPSDPEPNPADLLTEEQREQARQAADDYLLALAEKTAADNRQKQARTILATVVGDVGGFEIKWSGGKTKTEPDTAAALELLGELDQEVPTKVTHTPKRIVVNRL